MSQENLDLARRCAQAWNDRNWSTLPDLFDPDFKFDLSRNIFNPAVYHGHAGIEQWASAVEDVWDDFQGVFTELIDVGDTVVAGFTIRGKGKESGAMVEMKIFSVWTFRDSKVVRIVGGYRDRSEALEAAGLSEQDAHADS
jgi:ketosteroid isomerase-like protein